MKLRELPLRSQINIFSREYLTEKLPVFRLFLINSYQSGILLKIKRKLELNMYLDIRFYLKCLPFLFYLFGGSNRRCSVEPEMLCWSVPGGFAGFAGEPCARVYFLIELLVSGLRLCWRGGSGVGVYSCGFCEIFWGSFLQSTPWIAASLCFICDILQIYKLRKNILLDVILYITCL